MERDVLKKAAAFFARDHHWDEHDPSLLGVRSLAAAPIRTGRTAA